MSSSGYGDPPPVYCQALPGNFHTFAQMEPFCFNSSDLYWQNCFLSFCAVWASEMFYVPIRMKQKLFFSGLHLEERQKEIFTSPAHGI